jgi:hypothetical protein
MRAGRTSGSLSFYPELRRPYVPSFYELGYIGSTSVVLGYSSKTYSTSSKESAAKT